MCICVFYWLYVCQLCWYWKNIFLYSGRNLMSRRICTPLYYSFSANRVDSFEHQSVRRIWTLGPLCMGRRSSKIAGRKVCSWIMFDYIDACNVNEHFISVIYSPKMLFFWLFDWISVRCDWIYSLRIVWQVAVILV